MNHAEELKRVGLDPIPSVELVRVVYEGGVNLFMRFQTEGINKETRISRDQALGLAGDLVKAARLMARL